jgi:hypothetical protein
LTQLQSHLAYYHQDHRQLHRIASPISSHFLTAKEDILLAFQTVLEAYLMLHIWESLCEPLCVFNSYSTLLWDCQSLDGALFEQYRHDVERVFVFIVDVHARVKAKEDVTERGLEKLEVGDGARLPGSQHCLIQRLD